MTFHRILLHVAYTLRDNAVHRYSLCLLYLEYVESTGPADFLNIATEFLVRILLSIVAAYRCIYKTALADK